jgi:uncharacterized protein (TIRG00374 family)
MKKALFIVSSLLIGVLLFAVALQQVGWEQIKAALYVFPREAIILIFAINFLAMFVVGSWRWLVILRAQGCPADFWTVVRIKLAGFALSYITPSAFLFGEPIRAYMIKEEKKCSWEKSFASVIVDQTILFAALLVAMIVGFIFLAEHFSLSCGIVGGFLLLFVFSLLAFYLFYRRIVNRGKDEEGFFTYLILKTHLNRLGFIRNNLESIENTERVMETFFKEEKKSSALVILLGFLEAALDVSVVFFACYYLGHVITALESVAIFSFLTFASLIPIPGALGSFEVMLTFVFDLFGFGKENGLAFSLIYRLVNISFCGLGLAAFFHFMLKTASVNYTSEAPPLLLQAHRFLSRFLSKRNKK